LSFAETGHLVLATLPSNNADQTMDRIKSFFPESLHKQVLQTLSLNLRGIVSQRLVKAKDGKRRAAIEIMINTPMIRDMIKRDEIADLKEAMDKRLDAGMQTFDQALYNLYKEDIIELEEALRKADSKDGLELKINLSEGGGAGDEEGFDDELYDPSNF
jgi:twitching motility protein PilU